MNILFLPIKKSKRRRGIREVPSMVPPLTSLMILKDIDGIK